jgi:site-specific DNA recombinase
MANNARTKVGIYVRVSSEIQGEKASPQVQEDDARKYCEQRGYRVVEVYRDTQRYRINGGRLIEPSGTRCDRPELQRMLADAKAGYINMIVAWREDRLYRGIRPMLEVLDVIDEMRGALSLELVTETFDMTMAPIKAAIARMELATKNERWTLGMKGRLGAGKGFATPPYGYGYDEKSGMFYVDENEAQWVRLIYSLCADGFTMPEISKELIRRGAPQRMKNGGKTPWSTSVLYRVLRHEYYCTGEKTTIIQEQTYITKLIPLIDPETAAAVKLVMDEKKTGRKPGQRTRTYSTEWLAGLLVCKGHGYHMGQLQSTKGPAPYEGYACRNKYRHQQVDHPHCGGFVAMGWLDRYVWNKLSDFISDPVKFEASLSKRILQLREKQDAARKNLDKIQAGLDDIEMQRARVRKMYAKGYIDDDKLDQDMNLLQAEQEELEADISLADTDYTKDIAALEDIAKLYRGNLAQGVINLRYEPTDLKDFKKWSSAVKRIIRALVAQVTVDDQWFVEIKTHMDISKPLYVGRSNQTDIFTAVEESGWQEIE